MSIKLEFDKSALYQWDLNMRVILTDVPAGIEVHYDNINDSATECCDTAVSYVDNGNVYADIPNKVLQLNGIVQVYLYVQEKDKAWTEHKTEFLVLPRKRPANYVYSSTEVKQWDTLQKEINEIKKAQTDMNENNPESLAYIKNRTHWREEIPTDHAEFPNVEPDSNIGFVRYAKKVGLEIGKEYTVDVYLADGTLAQTVQGVATEFPPNELGGLEGVPCLESSIAALVDGVDVDLATGLPYIADNAFYVITDSAIGKIVIRDLPGVKITYHKIPKEYLGIKNTFDPDIMDPISGQGVKDALDKEVNPYLYKGKLKYFGETETTSEVSKIQITQGKVDDKNVIFRLRRVFIHIEIPSNNYDERIIVGAKVIGSPIYQNLTASNSMIMLTQKDLSALVDVIIEPLSGRAVFVTYGMDNTGSSYLPVGNHAVPQYSWIKELNYGSKGSITIEGIEISSTFRLPIGTKVQIWGESAL